MPPSIASLQFSLSSFCNTPKRLLWCNVGSSHCFFPLIPLESPPCQKVYVGQEVYFVYLLSSHFIPPRKLDSRQPGCWDWWVPSDCVSKPVYAGLLHQWGGGNLLEHMPVSPLPRQQEESAVAAKWGRGGQPEGWLRPKRGEKGGSSEAHVESGCCEDKREGGTVYCPELLWGRMV